ncbi:MAG: DEAD/DEAH box helicase family protein [Candidatus Methanofastidiosa archaeon]|nr:DEAD/DEAH box helicase family protein [Candidatus Methanofastidiosa archaeon]
MDNSFFPYDNFRANQEEFIQFVQTSLIQKKNPIVEAATGFGKTISVLSAILPLAEKLGKKIVYCCRTHKQMDRVMEELMEIGKKVEVSGISIKGRNSMCLHPTIVNNDMDTAMALHVCRLLRRENKCEFYENMKEKEDRAYEIEVSLSQKPSLSQDVVTLCIQENMCPYEVVKGILQNVEVISCSYMYIFHPEIRENFLEGIGATLEDIILVLDEAHNLPDLAINLGSDQLSIYSITNAINESIEFEESIVSEFLNRLYEVFLELENEFRLELDEEVIISYQDLFTRLEGTKGPFVSKNFEKTLFDLILYMKTVGEKVQKERLKRNKMPRSHIYRIATFLENWFKVHGNEGYCYIFEKTKTKKDEDTLKLEILSLDPRPITTQVLDYVFGAVHMSGTLEPLNAYSDMIGTKNPAYKVFPSPFSPMNIKGIVTKGVTTKGTHRNEEMYKKITLKALDIIHSVPANVGIFCSSYEVLDGLLNSGIALMSDKPVFVERRNMDSRENDMLVSDFKFHSGKKGAVLLGVMGGRNAEGGDYPGNEMNTVIIVGVPYARPSPRIEAQIDYYQKVFLGKGKYYGYYLPAHRKLSQAAGRAHRLLSDKALIVFLDERVANKFVSKDIPKWIRECLEFIPDSEEMLKEKVKTFFGIHR